MVNFKISKFIVFSFIAAIVIAVAAVYYINSKTPNIINNNNQTSEPVATGAPVSQARTLDLPIPFTSQAPTGNWDQVHNEDCEEAVSVMANAYLSGGTSTVLSSAQVETEMNNLNNWEDTHFGYHLDTTAEETAQMIESFYGLHATVQNGYTLQDIEGQLNLHRVVILPVNGQIIGNPYYTQPGPIYHMLVIRGYTPTELVTNDSGTKRGQDYPYTFQTLHNAGADWDHTTNSIDPSKKVMIVVWK